ncbi:recombinase family protein [Agrobacterium sp. CCNWLW32]|uniref:recombinase family protein n=1 Tax=Agrobacterium sp. CCNWLW32 TaxID=3122072 RepID=UPI003010010F
MKLFAYTLGVTKEDQDEQKARLVARFPEAAKVYSESCSRNGRSAGRPTRQTRGHALMAVKSGTVLATDKIERLGADEAEVTALCFALLEEGVQIVAIDDGVDTRKDSMFSVSIQDKLGKLKIRKPDARRILADARQLGARTRHVRLSDDKKAVIDQVTAQGAVASVRKQLRQQLLAQHEAKVVQLLNEGKTPTEIGQDLNVAERTVRNIAKHHGLNIDRRFKSGIKGRVLGAEDQQAIAKRIWNGEKATDLAREYGVQVRSIYRAQEVMEGRVKLKRYQNGNNAELGKAPLRGD